MWRRVVQYKFTDVITFLRNVGELFSNARRHISEYREPQIERKHGEVLSNEMF
jgi:hypothetical protein